MIRQSIFWRAIDGQNGSFFLPRWLLSLAKEEDGLQRLRDIAAHAPDSSRMLDELAWLLATYPDSKSRDGIEAVRLADRACVLTERKVPPLLDTLAAAYAETADFPRAISAAEEALNRAHSSGDSDAIKLSEKILASLREIFPIIRSPNDGSSISVVATLSSPNRRSFLFISLASEMLALHFRYGDAVSE
jgi:hypothetical protein